jgi:hypothetical protein
MRLVVLGRLPSAVAHPQTSLVPVLGIVESCYNRAEPYIKAISAAVDWTFPLSEPMFVRSFVEQYTAK